MLNVKCKARQEAPKRPESDDSYDGRHLSICLLVRQMGLVGFLGGGEVKHDDFVLSGISLNNRMDFLKLDSGCHRNNTINTPL